MITKKEEAQPIPLEDLREALLRLGFIKVREKAPSSGSKAAKSERKEPARRRFVRSGSWAFLDTHLDMPWYTLQSLSKGHVRWYMDFPVEAPREAILAFLQAL